MVFAKHVIPERFNRESSAFISHYPAKSLWIPDRIIRG